MANQAKTETGRGFARVLIVFEAIVEFGPISHDDLVDKTGISRTAIHRALKTLEDRHWIRPHLGSGLYAVTSSFVNQLKRTKRTYDDIDRLLPVLKDLAKSNRVHFDIAVMEDLVVPRVIESTRRKRLDDSENFFESPLALVAMAAEDPKLRLMIFKNAMDIATPEQTAMIREGELHKRIRAIGQRGYHEDQDTHSVIIPLKGYSGFTGAMRIGSALVNQPRVNVVHELAATLQSGSFGTIPAREIIQNINS